MNRENASAAHTDIHWDLKEGRLMDASREARLVGFQLPVVLSLGAWEECVWGPEYSVTHTILLLIHLRVAMGLSPVPPQVVKFRVPWEDADVTRFIGLEAECAPDACGRPFVHVRLADEEESRNREF